MISLDLTREAPVDTKKLHLMKGRKVSVCNHCHRSVARTALMRCNECRRDFCQNCLDACRCYTEGGFRIGRRRRQQPVQARHLALVSSGGARK
jgi:predicted sulfurtransferase